MRAVRPAIPFCAACATLLALGACAMPTPVLATSVCPAPAAYTLAQEQRAAREYTALPTGSMLRKFMDDYARERQMLRACRI